MGYESSSWHKTTRSSSSSSLSSTPKSADPVSPPSVTPTAYALNEERVAVPPASSLSEGARKLASFSMTPRQIKSALDERVVGQSEAKKALAVAISDHYHHAKRCLQDPSRLGRHFHKQNVLLWGPSGSGKSHLVRSAVDLAGAPLVKCDATKFSATGYVGRDVGDIVQQLIEQSNGDLETAQFGTVHVDEIDKICETSKGILGSVNTRDVQQSMLKLMEDFEVPLTSLHGISHQHQRNSKSKTFSTKHVLFVFSGAFHHCQDEFAPPPQSADDFVRLGLLREFVGRIPVRVSLQHLSVDDLTRILAAPNDVSPISRYVESFAAHGISLTYDNDALAVIAHRAHQHHLGARGLLTEVEATLREFSYHLPSCDIGGALHLDATAVDDPRTKLRSLLKLEDHVDLDSL